MDILHGQIIAAPVTLAEGETATQERKARVQAERDRFYKLNRESAAMELRVARHKAANDLVFLFHHNPRPRVVEFLQKNPWLSSRNTEQAIFRFADAFTSTLVGLQAGQKAYIDVTEQAMLGSVFLERGFGNFLRDLLRVIYPTLRHRQFRHSGRLNLFSTRDPENGLLPATVMFFWGDSRDPSNAAPKLAVLVRRKQLIPRVWISFVANRSWVDDRHGDVCSCVGKGNLALAMSQHPRLGQSSQLAMLDKELLRTVVSFLS